jgi:glycosyltransferase involved in cell wall biosynthesis
MVQQACPILLRAALAVAAVVSRGPRVFSVARFAGASQALVAARPPGAVANRASWVWAASPTSWRTMSRACCSGRETRPHSQRGAFDGHDLQVLAFCRGRGDIADRVAARLGKRMHFVTTSETLTLWACAAGFFSILRAAYSFRPHKMVLSLKQANVVGRLAAMLVPRLRCVAFEHIAEYRARRFQRLYGPLLRVLSIRVDEVWADCAETLEETRRYFLPRRRSGHVVPLFVAAAGGPFKTDYGTGSRLRLAAAGRLVARKNVALMVKAVGALRGEDVVATLDVYGEGPERQAIETLIGQHGLHESVTLHGYRADWVAQDGSLRERLGRQARADILCEYDAAACRQQVAKALSSPRDSEMLLVI